MEQLTGCIAALERERVWLDDMIHMYGNMLSREKKEKMNDAYVDLLLCISALRACIDE